MSADTGWIDTARRVLPRFLRLSRRTAPTWHLTSIADIDPDRLAEDGVEAFIWDVDGTLMSHHADRVDPSLAARFDQLLADPRFRHAIVSNCQLPRFAGLGEIFPQLPIVLGFETPAGPAFRVLEGGVESRLGPGREHLPVLGTGDPGPEVAPMRKPAAELVDVALGQIGLDRPDNAVMVGDQYFTDIVSANLAGARSIKVRTFDPPSFPGPVRYSQVFERGWVRLMRALGLATSGG
ncbi:MAG: HAD hydrolase-like protein [Gemmatimonadota bacterium]|nr:HAD hydrolase-like protein [Gemmatimonadota bacterium]